ncbi:MAG: dienelactone hydrolase family protein [Gammaproteobacteria bacterium]|nr:dienelactone hydrolase family protein [Gammaproteobacteria bacterium]
MLIQHQSQDITTATGPMRTSIYRPVENGQYPSIIFYSEIFQETAPIKRSAQILAGHGFVVLVPEVFHELNPIGTVLAYDDAGKDKGNADKFAKPLEQHDSDTQAMIDFIDQQTYTNKKIGVMGVCIGGHLAFRAALNERVLASYCLYPTDIHSDTLPKNEGNDSLTRCGDIKGEIHLIFGKQDPHVSTEGRTLIREQLIANNVNFCWQEVNAQHAFMRDEGERYDAALAMECYRQSIALFHRTLT